MDSRLRPAVRLLTGETVERIIGEAKEILDRVGVFVEFEEGVDLLAGAGARDGVCAGAAQRRAGRYVPVRGPPPHSEPGTNERGVQSGTARRTHRLAHLDPCIPTGLHEIP